MTIHEQEKIVMECRRLAYELNQKCAEWMHTAQFKRYPSAALDLSAAADAMYVHLHTFNDLMGSDQGKPAFDEYNKEADEEFQANMNNFWENLDEPDFREKRRLRHE